MVRSSKQISQFLLVAIVAIVAIIGIFVVVITTFPHSFPSSNTNIHGLAGETGTGCTPTTTGVSVGDKTWTNQCLAASTQPQTLLAFSCNADGTADYSFVDCASSGQNCQDGACGDQVVKPDVPCNDPDGGINLFRSSTSTGLLENIGHEGYVNGVLKEYVSFRIINASGWYVRTDGKEFDTVVDSCNGDTLTEGVCYSSNPGDNESLHWLTHTCEHGCADGACINITPLCSDTDVDAQHPLGDNKDVKGTVYYYQDGVLKNHTDSCMGWWSPSNGHWITEYDCAITPIEALYYQVSTTQKRCTNLCEDGACRTTPGASCIGQMFGSCLMKENPGCYWDTTLVPGFDSRNPNASKVIGGCRHYPPTDTSKLDCTDTETWPDPFTKGTVTGFQSDSGTGFNYVTNYVRTVMNDTCGHDNATLADYYCRDGLIDLVRVVCSSGCSDGTCNPVDPATAPCYDTDGGQNPFLKGNVTSLDNSAVGTDFCVNSTHLNEFFCKDGTQPAGMGYNCQPGYSCNDGACKPEDPATALCTDTDGGDSLFTKGTATAGDVNKTDTCQNTTTITEYYCSGGQLLDGNYTCPTGYSCDAGACVPES